ncbi:hypothetical protein DM02DRAFT_621707 [Periconia macrospinosa]|uniref:RING-type domain-containing protein n=1 Tax=Periconia macrospinosa TaxID=97972 RepID=A0A2V1ECB0_9PLEO|nr:hypothetical protein DM02DRAFT_621707 [Periconia macrospinosa]
MTKASGFAASGKTGKVEEGEAEWVVLLFLERVRQPSMAQLRGKPFRSQPWLSSAPYYSALPPSIAQKITHAHHHACTCLVVGIARLPCPVRSAACNNYRFSPLGLGRHGGIFTKCTMASITKISGRDSPMLPDDTYKSSFLPPTVYAAPMRDSKKAQKMLGLGSGFPTLSRRGASNPEVDETTKKAKRVAGLVVTEPRDRRSWCASVGSSSTYSGTLEERLKQAEDDVRRLSGMDALIDHDDESITTWHTRKQQTRQSTSTRGWIDIGLEEGEEAKSNQSHPSSLPPHLARMLTPEPLFAPSSEPIELDAISTQHICRPATRSRQSSCASSRFHARPTHKIASSRSRGLRADTCPSFSRPSSVLMKTVPGEDMERDPLHLRYGVEPPTPNSPAAKDSFAFDDVKEARVHIEQQLKLAMDNHGKTKTSNEPEARPKRPRWASLPSSFVKLTKRHSKPVEETVSDHTTKQHQVISEKKKDKVDLTTENLQRWEHEVGHLPKMYRMSSNNLVSTSPVEIDITVNETQNMPNITTTTVQTPYMPPPRLQDPTLTPPSSPSLTQPKLYHPQHHHHYRHSSSHLPSPTLSTFPKPPPSPLLTPPLSHAQVHTRRTSLLSLASQKEFASAEKANTLFTCSICKEAEHPSTFPLRKITKQCIHPTRTCLDCLRGWIEMCVREERWDGCTCPECGLSMSEDDINAFRGVGGFVR